MTEAEVLAALEVLLRHLDAPAGASRRARDLGEPASAAAPVTLKSRLAHDLGLDSLQLMALAVKVENHFRVRLEEADDESVSTIGDLVAVIRRAQAREERFS